MRNGDVHWSLGDLLLYRIHEAYNLISFSQGYCIQYPASSIYGKASQYWPQQSAASLSQRSTPWDYGDDAMLQAIEEIESGIFTSISGLVSLCAHYPFPQLLPGESVIVMHPLGEGCRTLPAGCRRAKGIADRLEHRPAPTLRPFPGLWQRRITSALMKSPWTAIATILWRSRLMSCLRRRRI